MTHNTKTNIPPMKDIRCPSLGMFAIIVAILALGIGIFYVLFHTPLQKERQFIEQRMTQCIEQLEEYANSLNPQLDYSVAEYRYDPEGDQCLYRGSYVTDTPEGRYFEKFIIDVFTNTTLATYTELDGVPTTEDISVFSAEIDRLFPTEKL